MKMLNLALFLLLNSHALPAQEGSAHTTLLAGSQIAFFNDVSQELICQCGCHLVLNSCGHVNCPSAVPMRSKIESMILEKKSKEEILSYFITEYTFEGKIIGRKVLSQPDTKGFDLVAWVLPFALFLIFIFVVIFALKKYSKKNPTLTETLIKMSPEETKRIEEELKKMDSQ